MKGRFMILSFVYLSICSFLHSFIHSFIVEGERMGAVLQRDGGDYEPAAKRRVPSPHGEYFEQWNLCFTVTSSDGCLAFMARKLVGLSNFGLVLTTALLENLMYTRFLDMRSYIVL